MEIENKIKKTKRKKKQVLCSQFNEITNATSKQNLTKKRNV